MSRNIKYHETLYNLTLDRIDEAEDLGLFSEDPEENAEFADQNREIALSELEERIADEDSDSEDYPLNYTGGSMADFSSAFEFNNDYGVAVLELLQNEYEDLDEGLEDLMDVTGVDEEILMDIIEGYCPPDFDFTEAVASLFETTSEDENAYEELHELSEDAEDELLEAYEMLDELDELEEVIGDMSDEELDEAIYAEDEEDEYEDYDEDEEYYDEDEEDEYEDAYEDDGSYDEEASYRIAELENVVAEFQMEGAVNNELTALMDYAEEGIDAGWLRPKKFDILFGNFNRDEDRVAQFSANVAEDGVDIDTALYAIQYALSLDEALGPVANFSQYVEDEISDEDLEFEADLEYQARLNLEHMRHEGQLGRE